MTVISCPATVTFVVEAPPALMFAVVYPAELFDVFCGAVQFAGTLIVITAPEARPPVVAVYVAVSVLFVVPAKAVVGATFAVPAPSAELFTFTVWVPETVVSVPPLVDFSLPVKT